MKEQYLEFMRSRLTEETKLRNFIRKIIREEAGQVVPGDVPAEEQVHLFDFDDTLGVTTNANAVMLYQDGSPAHKSEAEAKIG
jgi:hypothetical protein